MTRLLRQELSSGQKKAFLLGLICLLALAGPLLAGPQADMTNDEGIYQLMAQSFAESGSLIVWNGYEELPSAELVLPFTQVYQGHLVPQYPYLTAILNYPLYRLAGFTGLLLLNAIAYVATIGICFLTARALFRDTALALNACLILAFATYSLEYSQAAWPHALSMLFVAVSVYFAVAALVSPRPRASLALALAGGAVAGFGAGVRLDVIFVLPALVVPFIFARPWRPWCALAACLGSVPGLAVLAATNYAKFGVFSAFAYSPNVSGGAGDPASYLPIALIGLAFLAAAWFISRHRSSVNARLGRWLLLAGLAAVTSIILFVPTLQRLVFRMADGVYQLLVDLRIRDLDFVHGGLSRGPGGGMVYLASVKKALLQSCPYLVMLAVPIAMLLRGAKHSMSFSVLLLPPAAFVASYGYFAWDGGTGLNLRYFVPILPFTSILAAFAWREITDGLSDSQRRISIVAGALAGGLYLALILLGPSLVWEPWTLGQQEAIFLSLPLGIAAMALTLVLWAMVRPGVRVRSAAAAVLAVGFVWSGMVAFSHDFPRAHSLRKLRAEQNQSLARFVQDDSVVVTMEAHLFYDLLIDHRVRIVLPWRDDFAGLDALVAFYLDRDQAVYVWITEYFENEIRRRQLFNAYTVVPLYEIPSGRFVQLLKPAERNGS